MIKNKIVQISIILILLLITSIFISSKNTNIDKGNIPNQSISITSTPKLILTSTPTSNTTTPITTTNIIPTTVLSESMDKWIFYPVDKTTALDKDFIPKNLVFLSKYNISVSSSTFQMRKEVIDDLKSLFDDAKSDGIYLRVTSPYRSYETQVATFNYWKNLELQKGLSDEQATIEANKSSAFPGHSEHQLGTTCDVISGQDTTLDFTDSNKKVWKWMDGHLVEHGFVLSYPEGKEPQTGYVYEPWHIRWVGKDIALQIQKTDYVNPSNDSTSTKYLRQIWNKLNI